MKRLFPIIAALAFAPFAWPITATKEYVDRRDTEITNATARALAQVAANVATNAATIAAIQTVATNAAPRTASITLQGTNLTARVVYSASTSPRVSLFIRETTTPSGERQYRLIRKEDEQ